MTHDDLLMLGVERVAGVRIDRPRIDVGFEEVYARVLVFLRARGCPARSRGRRSTITASAA
jgi:hypothetical protein